jgi:putative hydroxymethylpyrimidine transporter CytX
MGRWLREPEEWGTEPVPEDRRRLRAVDLGILWFSLGVGLLVLFAGALLVLALGLSLLEVLGVSVVGSVIGSAMLAAAGLPGSRYGVPTMVSLRPVLGRRASWVPSGLNALQLLGWASFELMIMGLGVAAVTGGFLGELPTAILWIGVLAVWVTVLALGGPLVVIRQWLERVAVWLVIGSTAWLSYVVLADPTFPARFLAPSGASPGSLGVGLDLVIALPISWWPLVSDYNRFARRPRESFTGTFVGYTLSNSWFFFLGAALLVVFGLQGESSGPVAFVRAIVGTPLGFLVLLLIVVDETDNAFANVYSTAVTIQNIAPRLRQRRLILLASTVSFLLGAVVASRWEVFAPLYEGFLLFIGGVFVPLLGVMVADRLIRRSYRPDEFASGAPTWRGTALGSWIAGMVLYFAIAGVGLVGTEVSWVSSAWASPIGASLPAFGLAAGLYALASWLTSPSAGQAPA